MPRIGNEHTIMEITGYAQKALHAIVYTRTPTIGFEVKQKEPMGTVE